MTNLKIVELQRQLSEKHNKLEQVLDKIVEYLQQVNELLQEKFSDHRRYDQLQIQNASLKQQLEELQHDHKQE